jgi:threonine/homoserine/homoserine lactone efflux protein
MNYLKVKSVLASIIGITGFVLMFGAVSTIDMMAEMELNNPIWKLMVQMFIGVLMLGVSALLVKDDED